uniref:Uncharacterized protein n=1 Tax=Timema tahoe TaxID=61484 RepID=A0A7R9NW49_9NEOP|nr:unnamed protein product [Timema tahoe]
MFGACSRTDIYLGILLRTNRTRTNECSSEYAPLQSKEFVEKPTVECGARSQRFARCSLHRAIHEAIDFKLCISDFPGMCYDKYGDVFHEEGANWFDNVNCVKYTCRQDYDDNHMVVVTNGKANRDLNPNLLVIGCLVYCDSDALDHATTEAGASSWMRSRPARYGTVTRGPSIQDAARRFGARTPGDTRIGATSSTKTTTTATSYTLLVGILRGLVPGHQATHVSALPPQQQQQQPPLLVILS